MSSRDSESILLHLRGLRTTNPGAYDQLVRMYQKMSTGGDGGQVEGWSFNTVRSEFYTGWTDDDFVSLLRFLGNET